MAILGFLQTRITNLEKNLEDCFNLATELSNAIMLADNDSLTKRRYQADLQRVIALTKTWEAEYIELSTKIQVQANSDPTVSTTLQNLTELYNRVQEAMV
ncbi:MAG: hypothetical protein WCS37_12015 [Chloroflexota bacterium]|nr:hypothetical protein [Chloroflexota bacterium]